MKIALLNPWRNAAENQLVPGITRVAEALGHQTIECTSAREIEEQQPDFVLSMSRTQPKLTDVPTYGLVFDPRHILIERPSYLHNILSYDGVFTVFETLQQFLSDVMFAVRREPMIGEFYPTAPEVAWDDEIAFDQARLAYFGINWDRRRHSLFALLDAEPWMDVYGPEHGWASVVQASYRGEVPFDGTSVLSRYRAAGAGLCLFSDGHFADNIVTSRVFEICAAGAIVIAPRMPWLEQNFGDAVLYFDQDRADTDIHKQLRQHLTWIRTHPAEAAALAARSQWIFAKRFSLDVLLPNVFAFHERVMASRKKTASATAEGGVSVIVPWSEGSAGRLRRSLESIVRQDDGPVEVIVAVASASAAGDAELAMAALANADRDSGDSTSVISWRTVIAEQPSQAGVQAGAAPASSLLWTGLRACQGAYVAVLPCGDEWMAGHIASLMAALNGDSGGALALSSSILHHDVEFMTRGGGVEVRRLLPFPFAQSRQDVVQDALEIPAAALLFRRSLLDQWILDDPRLQGGYDAYLIVSLLAKTTPVFTHRATAICYQSGEAFRRRADPAFTDDVARLRLRFVGRAFPPAPRMADFGALQRVVERGETRRQQDVGEVRCANGVTQYCVPAAFEYLVGTEDTWTPVALRTVVSDVELLGVTRPEADAHPAISGVSLPLIVEPPAEPWAHGLRWRLALPEDRPYVIRLSCRVEAGTAGFGVMDGRMRHFTYRLFAQVQAGRVIADLPISDPEQAPIIVVQSTLASRSVRVIVEDVQVFAATSQFPMDAVKTLLREFEQFRVTQETAQQQLRDKNEALQDALLAARQDQDDARARLAAAQALLEKAASQQAEPSVASQHSSGEPERLSSRVDADSASADV